MSTTTTTTTAPVKVPGPMLEFIDGTDLAYEPHDLALHGYGTEGRDLVLAIAATPERRAGRGYYKTLNLTAGELDVLAHLAATLHMVVAGGDDSPAEERAAEATLQRVRDARHYLATGEDRAAVRRAAAAAAAPKSMRAAGLRVGDTVRHQRGRKMVRRYEGTVTALTHEGGCQHCERALKEAIADIGRYRDTERRSGRVVEDEAGGRHRAKIAGIRRV
jgi:hypothetical protein